MNNDLVKIPCPECGNSNRVVKKRNPENPTRYLEGYLVCMNCDAQFSEIHAQINLAAMRATAEFFNRAEATLKKEGLTSWEDARRKDEFVIAAKELFIAYIAGGMQNAIDNTRKACGSVNPTSILTTKDHESQIIHEGERVKFWREHEGNIMRLLGKFGTTGSDDISAMTIAEVILREYEDMRKNEKRD